MSQAPSARDVLAGSYRFLPGIAPFSSGAAALPGHQVVHATTGTPIPWREGFDLIDRHLRAEGRPRAALCAIELRSPAPFTFAGFDTTGSTATSFQCASGSVDFTASSTITQAMDMTVTGGPNECVSQTQQ